MIHLFEEWPVRSRKCWFPVGLMRMSRVVEFPAGLLRMSVAVAVAVFPWRGILGL